VLGGVKVLGGVAILGIVATAHLPALHAEAEVDPGVAHLQALLAALGVGVDGVMDGGQVLAALIVDVSHGRLLRAEKGKAWPMSDGSPAPFSRRFGEDHPML
jgi:hypothetical protein